MDTLLIIHQFYDTSIEKVWDALTDENKMRAWYFPQLKKFTPVVGFVFEFADDGSSYKKEWTVTAVEPGKKLSHSWIYKDYPGRSEVSFELSKDETGTSLKLTHTGLGSFPSDPHFARKRFEDGWKRILGSDLKNFLDRKD